MVNRIAIIDLGSNTFHMLIADKEPNGRFETVVKERRFVGLAAEGIDVIPEDRIESGLNALIEFKQLLIKYNVVEVRATGTSALRSAKNGQHIVDRIKKEVDLDVIIIQGSREAELIYKGVALINDMSEGNHLIMDIGGGSVEFILIENGVKRWSQSYNIGVGVLYNRFSTSNPILEEEIMNIREFILDAIEDLSTMVENLPIATLVGASGSFEVVESMNGLKNAKHTTSSISLEDYYNVSRRIIHSTLEERKGMEGLPSSRIRLIVVAMIMIDLVLEISCPNDIVISPYALKEGLLSEI